MNNCKSKLSQCKSEKNNEINIWKFRHFVWIHLRQVWYFSLAHWGRLTHISVSNLVSQVQIMTCCMFSIKPLSEPMMVSLLMCICVTRPQRVELTKTPHNSPLRASYEVSIVSILEKIHHVRRGNICTNLKSLFHNSLESFALILGQSRGFHHLLPRFNVTFTLQQRSLILAGEATGNTLKGRHTLTR